MKRLLALCAALALIACAPSQPSERYGFVARLGNDTVTVESVMRRGNTVTSDEVDRFPRVRRRHTEIELGPDGEIRHVVVDVTKESVHLSKKDGTATITRAFATNGGTAMAHVDQMYSTYELYFANALRRAATAKRSP